MDQRLAAMAIHIRGVSKTYPTFIDPEGYRAYIDSGEARFRSGVVQ